MIISNRLSLMFHVKPRFFPALSFSNGSFQTIIEIFKVVIRSRHKFIIVRNVKLLFIHSKSFFHDLVDIHKRTCRLKRYNESFYLVFNFFSFFFRLSEILSNLLKNRKNLLQFANHLGDMDILDDSSYDPI